MEEELKSSWERPCEIILRNKRCLHSLHSRTLSHAVQHCTHILTHYQPPQFTPGTHCCPGLLQGSGEHLVAGLVATCLGKMSQQHTPGTLWSCGGKRLARQRARARIPCTPRYTLQPEEDGAIERPLCLLLIATRKGNEPAWTQSEGTGHMHTALPVLQHHPKTWSPVDRYPENILLLLSWVVFEGQQAS